MSLDFPDQLENNSTVYLYFGEGLKKKACKFSALDSGGWTRSRHGGQGRSSGLQLTAGRQCDLPWTPRPAAHHRAQGHSRVQLCLRAEAGLTFNLELLDCLAPLPLVCFCLLSSVSWVPVQFTPDVACSQLSGPPTEDTMGWSLRKLCSLPRRGSLSAFWSPY